MCFTKILRRVTKYEHAEMRYGNNSFDLLVANTYSKLMLGLMKLKSIGKHEGMILVFKREARHGIWMLNMNFPIDIIWLDKNFKVVDIAYDAQPCNSILNCITYYPIENARYVVEITSGMAKRMKLKKGAKVAVKLRKE